MVDSITCPFCGGEHPLDEGDNYYQVTTHWGEEAHDFSCSHCEKDFLVKEVITREYVIAKTHEDLDT